MTRPRPRARCGTLFWFDERSLYLSTKTVCPPNAPSANRPSIGLRSTGVIFALRKIYSLKDREEVSRRLRDCHLIYSWQVVRQHTTMPIHRPLLAFTFILTLTSLPAQNTFPDGRLDPTRNPSTTSKPLHAPLPA